MSFWLRFAGALCLVLFSLKLAGTVIEFSMSTPAFMGTLLFLGAMIPIAGGVGAVLLVTPKNDVVE